jgi:hypothetical protein
VMRSLLLTSALALATSGCAARGFEHLYPGMTAAQVADAMGRGPARAQEFGDGSAAWYFDEDHCVLMRDHLLVAKDTSRTRVAVKTPVATLKDQDKAWCGPPGTSADTPRQQTLQTPFGTFKGTVDPAAVTEQVRNSVRSQQVPPADPPPSTVPEATKPTP